MRKLAGLVLIVAAVACDKPKEESVDKPTTAAAETAASSPAKPSAAPLAQSAALKADDAGGTASADAGAKKSGKGPAIELLSAGADPKRELRYVFKKGQKEKVNLTTTTKLKMSMMGKDVDAPATPPVSMIASVEVLSVDAGGTAKRKLAVETVRLVGAPGAAPNGAADQLKAQLGALEKLRGRDEVDPRGVVQSIKMEFEGSKDPQLEQIASSMEQNFGQLGAPFPEEAIGVGAKWRVQTRLEQMGFRLDQTATYKLVSVDGDKGKLEIVIAQKAPKGKLQLPGMPPGASADLESMTGNGKGNIDFLLTRSVGYGKMETTADIHVQMMMGAEAQKTGLKMTMNVSLEPVKK